MTSFEMTAVSRHVNKVANDDPQCIEPATTQRGLF
jgi:putative SOS response-associated peptidase YedK